MATFVLIAGAFHSGSSWKKVRDILAQDGHRVFTPSLTGLGERRHLLSQSVDLETHISDVVNLLDVEDLRDVVLCGHSYGGVVITGAADRAPDRVRGLVYLDALVVDDGECANDVLPPESVAAVMEGVRTQGEGWMAPPPPAERYNVNVADREWVDKLCSPHPAASLRQPLKLFNSGSGPLNKIFIYATGWGESTSITKSYGRAKARGWRTMEAPCGHDIMVDMPELVADALCASARQGQG